MKDKTFQVYKNYILKFAKEKYKEHRKRIFSLDYYLSSFIKILKDVTRWELLKDPSKKKCHWKSVYNEFCKWSKDNIFEEAFNSFLQENYFKHNKLKKNKNINLFVDTTRINNKKGSEKISMNPEYRKKNVTNVQIVCDDNQLPLGMFILDVYKKDYNKNSSSHEITGLPNTLNAIPLNFSGYKKINVMGDKGFVTSKKYSIHNNPIRFISIKRKNQQKQSAKEKDLLKKRYVVENMFAFIKNDIRLDRRMDKKIHTFSSFLYMKLLECHFNYLEKHN